MIPTYEDADDRRDRESGEAEDRAMEADPYSNEEKGQMGSPEFFDDKE